MMIEPPSVWGTSRLWDPPSPRGPRSEETPVIFSLPYVAQAGETEVGMGSIGLVGLIHFLHLKPLKLLEHLWSNNCQHGLGQFLLRWFKSKRLSWSQLNESKRLESNHKLKNGWWMILMGFWKSTIINPPPMVERSKSLATQHVWKYGPGLKAYYNQYHPQIIVVFK